MPWLFGFGTSTARKLFEVSVWYLFEYPRGLRSLPTALKTQRRIPRAKIHRSGKP